MTSYPYTWLFVGKSTSVAVSGPHLQVLDTHIGSLLHSTTTLEESKKAEVILSGPIRCVDVDPEFRHVAATGEDKKLKVWRVDGLELLSVRELPKKPTEIHFTRDGQTILVSDKFGDIFSYPLHPDPTKKSTSPEVETTGTSKRSAIISHENPSDGTLILGHTSLLTTFILTEDEKYVISADRDEHIRVSWHPQGYVIERFCLGHRKFVSALYVPSFASSTLISGGGDPELKLWDWMSGEHLGDIPILQIIEPHLTIRPPKGRAGQPDEDGGEQGAEVQKGGERKGRGKKGKGRGKSKAKAETDNNDESSAKIVGTADVEVAEDVIMEEGVAEESKLEAQVQDGSPDGPSLSESQATPLVLVIRRILSTEVPGQGRYIVFSAVGATAIFYFSFPADLKTQQPEILALDLHRPIIDFSVDEAGRVWVLVDGERQGMPSDDPTTAESSQSAVRLLHWADGKLTEVSEDSSPALLAALNSSCKIPATSADLKALDLYSPLANMPKNVDPEHDPMRSNDLEALEAAANPFDASSRDGTPQTGEGAAKTRELTQREAARRKRKQALEAKIQQDQAVAVAGPSSEPEARESKKSKVEAEFSQPAGREDILTKGTAQTEAL